jgi:phosphopantetheine adenylyltransferase
VWKQQITRTRALFQNISALVCSDSELCKWFESQRRQNAILELRQSAEKRKQDVHEFAVLLAEAKVDHQVVLTSLQKSNAFAAAHTENRPQEARKAA